MRATIQRYVLSIALAATTALSMQATAPASVSARQPSAASVARVAPVRAKPLVLAVATSVDIANVTLTRAASGLINKPQSFTAVVTPANATLPITFTWQADEQTPLTVTLNAITSTAVFTWSNPGTKFITVTAENESSAVTKGFSLTLSSDFNLTILHTNDVHARLVPYGVGGTSSCVNNVNSNSVCIAGAARLSTKIKEIRSQVDNSLLLDAGDQFQGTLYYNLFKSEPIAAVMNAMGYQAMAIGNHEFDDGPPELREFIDAVNFPLVSANISATAEPLLTGKIAPSVIITVNGEAIGVVGLTTEDTANISSPGPNVQFLPRVPAMQQAVNDLQAQGVNRIIGLTHIGYGNDLALAQAITGVDVIVGGHTHTFLYTPTNPITVAPGAVDTPAGPYPTVVSSANGEPVLVVQAFQWGRYLGRLDVTFSPTGVVKAWSGNPIFMTNTIPLDPVITNILSPTYTGPVAALATQVVGTSTVDMPLTIGSARICRRVECLLGNFVTDAMLWKANQNRLPAEQFQIAYQNGGGLRAAIDAGPVTFGEVLELLPFGNTLATFEITGSVLLQALENGVRNYPEDGRFPQVSGMRFLWDPYRPIGSRVISVEVRNPVDNTWQPISPTARYKVVTNNFVRQGGDFYTMFRNQAINPYDFGPALDEAVIEYLGQFSPVTPTLEGRIIYTRRSAIVPRFNLLPANGISTTVLTITLRDTILSPLGGVSVTVLTNKGTVSPASGTTIASGSSAGQLVVTLTALLDAGPATIFAVGGSQVVSTVVNFFQDASTVNFSPSVITQTGVSGGVAQSGSIITYTITVTNAGPGNANNVLLIGMVPSGTQYVSGSASGGFGPNSLLSQQFSQQSLSSLSSSSSVVTWQGSVPTGGSHTMSYAVRVTALGGVITATSRILLDNTEVYTNTISSLVQAYQGFLPIVRR
jgi:5'-nucleotidase/UDP-sugar diphosphatase